MTSASVSSLQMRRPEVGRNGTEMNRNVPSRYVAYRKLKGALNWGRWFPIAHSGPDRIELLCARGPARCASLGGAGRRCRCR
jgi:hypothetical protein